VDGSSGTRWPRKGGLSPILAAMYDTDVAQFGTKIVESSKRGSIHCS
jgi:hypothetical protein